MEARAVPTQRVAPCLGRLSACLPAGLDIGAPPSAPALSPLRPSPLSHTLARTRTLAPAAAAGETDEVAKAWRQALEINPGMCRDQPRHVTACNGM